MARSACTACIHRFYISFDPWVTPSRGGNSRFLLALVQKKFIVAPRCAFPSRLGFCVHPLDFAPVAVACLMMQAVGLVLGCAVLSVHATCVTLGRCAMRCMWCLSVHVGRHEDQLQEVFQCYYSDNAQSLLAQGYCWNCFVCSIKQQSIDDLLLVAQVKYLLSCVVLRHCT